MPRPIEIARLETAVGVVILGRGGLEGRPAVVYLHSAGGESPSDSAAPFLTELARFSDVYAPMLPGFGGSEGLDEIDDIEDAAYHTLDVLERLALTGTGAGAATGPPNLVGLSLGGWLAAEIAWRYPDKIGSLVLVNPVGIHLAVAPMKELFGRSLDELARDTFADQSHPVAAIMHQLSSTARTSPASVPFEIVRPFYEAMAASAKLGWNPYFHNPKLPRRLSRVTCPTLVLAGRLDRLVPNAVAGEYARLIPGASLRVIEDASHMMALEQPERLAALVREHIEGVGEV